MVHRPATPKQVAYLTFMGVTDAASLSVSEAGQRINSLFEVNDQAQWAWLYERQGKWSTERYLMYSELYESEFNTFIDTQFPEEMHTYVRTRIVRASETLTKEKIGKVLWAMTAENRVWWRDKDRKEHFFQRLSQMFPGCCDGEAPRHQPRSDAPPPQQMRFSLFDHDSIYSLLTHYSQYCESWEVSLSDGTTTADPQKWLASLDNERLTSCITKKSSGCDGSFYTIEFKRLFRTIEMTFSVIWHADRHGWADAGAGSRVVHYFVPPAWLATPSRSGPNSLLSLCKKNWIRNDSPFYPVAPERALCQKCISQHEAWNSQ